MVAYRMIPTAPTACRTQNHAPPVTTASSTPSWLQSTLVLMEHTTPAWTCTSWTSVRRVQEECTVTATLGCLIPLASVMEVITVYRELQRQHLLTMWPVMCVQWELTVPAAQTSQHCVLLEHITLLLVRCCVHYYSHLLNSNGSGWYSWHSKYNIHGSG